MGTNSNVTNWLADRMVALTGAAQNRRATALEKMRARLADLNQQVETGHNAKGKPLSDIALKLTREERDDLQERLNRLEGRS